MLTSFFSFIVVLGILVFFHELGHFIVARFFGVGVEKFSLGFGPRILGKTIGMTDYRISAVPLGGYVKMVGEDPDVEIEPENLSLSFTHKHVFKRICIVAAGPISNLLLAVVIFLGFFLIVGIEDVTPVIRGIDKNGAAYQSGLKKDDLILSIDSKPVLSWYDINKAVEGAEDDALLLRVKRGENIFEAEVVPGKKTGKDIFGDEIAYLSFGAYAMPDLAAVVGNVSADSPAEKSGLKKGDKIVAIDEKPIEAWDEMRKLVVASDGKPLLFEVLRNGEMLRVTLTPALREQKNILGQTQKQYLIGISTTSTELDKTDRILRRLDFFGAVAESFRRTYFVAEISIMGIVKMINGSISRDNLGGPIMIAQIAGKQAKEGLDKFIQFIAFISINLAVLNFLPIPILDGGHLLFFACELVLRRPLSLRVREVAQQGGLFVLILLMAFVFYNDIARLFLG